MFSLCYFSWLKPHKSWDLPCESYCDSSSILDFNIKLPYIILEKKRFSLIEYELLCLNFTFYINAVQIYVLWAETVFFSGHANSFCPVKHKITFLTENMPVHGTRGLRLRSTAGRQPHSWFRITPGTWMFVCVLSGIDLCDEMIAHPGCSYCLWGVDFCNQDTSCYEEAIACTGLHSHRRQ
jgi:hypothetical protein